MGYCIAGNFRKVKFLSLKDFEKIISKISYMAIKQSAILFRLMIVQYHIAIVIPSKRSISKRLKQLT